MRELKIVGLDLDGKHIICEGDDPADKFKIRVDDRLRAALHGDGARVAQTHIDIEVTNMLTPREIQARIRSGASVEQLATAADADIDRIARFAHPVLLERSRAAELATAAHPILADGPAVLTLLETITSSLMARGLNPDGTTWDAWRNEDGRWTIQLGWKAGRSDNVAHFRFCPGAHGGTVTAVDDAASELINPNFDRPLRPVAALPQLEFDEPAPAPEPAATPQPEPKVEPAARARRAKPAVPAWEDVLLGVRSSGQR
jgi:Protein of unknown function (DUF3071)